MVSLNKTQTALVELTELLSDITKDNELTVQEVEAIFDWMDRHKTVVNRADIKDFTVWFKGIVADGEITQDEAQELLDWTNKLREDPDVQHYIKVREAGSDAWRLDKVTEKQIAFLEELGCPSEVSQEFTKGEASEKIDDLLHERRDREYSEQDRDEMGRFVSNKSGNGCMVVISAIIFCGLYIIFKIV